MAGFAAWRIKGFPNRNYRSLKVAKEEQGEFMILGYYAKACCATWSAAVPRRKWRPGIPGLGVKPAQARAATA
jgi:hypothetical protein